MTENVCNSDVYATIGIVGAGAWGTALGVVAAQSGRRVILWARESDVVDSINTNHENARFLPGVALALVCLGYFSVADALQKQVQSASG